MMKPMQKVASPLLPLPSVAFSTGDALVGYGGVPKLMKGRCSIHLGYAVEQVVVRRTRGTHAVSR
jgi:hypothetical protein